MSNRASLPHNFIIVQGPTLYRPKPAAVWSVCYIDHSQSQSKNSETTSTVSAADSRAMSIYALLSDVFVILLIHECVCDEQQDRLGK